MTKEKFEKTLLDARDAGIQAVMGMEDNYPCGGAYHTADGNSQIVRMFKKYGIRGNQGRENHYEVMGWTAYKASKGYIISHGGNRYQNMDMHSRRTTAESGVLGMNELPTSVHTYID